MALNKFIWPAAAWTLFITVLCLVSMDTFRSVNKIDFEYKDKVVHASFYFIFTIFWYLFFRSANIKNILLSVFLFAVGYGIFIEICQGVFTTGRSADIMDVIANTTGSAIAVLLIWLVNKYKNNK